MTNAYRISVGKTSENILLGRPGSRWEDIKIDIKEMVIKKFEGLRIGSIERLL
jgi:hypothetical protein